MSNLPPRDRASRAPRGAAQSKPDGSTTKKPAPKKADLTDQRRSIVKAALQGADGPMTLPELVKKTGLNLSQTAMGVRQLELQEQVQYADGEGYTFTSTPTQREEDQEPIRQPKTTPAPSTPQTPAEYKAWLAQQRR